MMEFTIDVVIPDRPTFKAAEVCELLKVQPYVLRSWENEFKDLGAARTPGGPRVYRRTDVERAFRIRQLVFDEGLTLAGVRRRLDQEKPQPDDDEVPVAEATRPTDPGMRIRIERARQGLRGVLDLLDRATPSAWPSSTPTSPRSEGTAQAGGATANDPIVEPVGHDDADSPSGEAGGELFDLDASTEPGAGAAAPETTRTRKPGRRRKADAPA